MSVINLQAGERVRIIGSHPHAGCIAVFTGEILKIGFSDLLRLIFADYEESGAGCFAARENLVKIEEEDLGQ